MNAERYRADPSSRAALVERLSKPELDLVAISAPAGFGKSTLAKQIAAARSSNAVCDCSAGGAALARAIVSSLAEELPDDAPGILESRLSVAPSTVEAWRRLAMELWQRPIERLSTFTFDNLESILGSDAEVRFLSTLMARRPSNRRVILCSRARIPRAVTRHTPPHRAAFVTAEDLRLQLGEVAALLAEAGGDPLLAARIADRSGGWPIGVLLMIRLAAEGRLSLSEAEDTSFEGLFAYLSDEYVAQLSRSEFEMLLCATAAGDATPDELAAWSGAPSASVREFLTDSPFFSVRADGAIDVHPLMSSLLSKRYASELKTQLAGILDSCAQAGDTLRGAEIASRRGDSQRVLQFLGQLPPDLELRDARRLASLVESIDRETILRSPAIWLATFEARRFSLSPEDLLTEARRVYASLPPNADPALRAKVVVPYVNLLINTGNSADVDGLIDDALEFGIDMASRAELEVLRVSAATMRGGYLRARRMFRSSGLGPETWEDYSSMLDFVESTVALRSGEYERGIATLEEAARMSREQGLVSRLLVNLSNLAIETWLQHDDQRFSAVLAEIKGCLLPGIERAWTFFFDAGSGRLNAVPTGYELPSIRSFGYIFQSTMATGPEKALCAAAAVKEADASGDIAVRIFARILLAEADPKQRAAALTEAESLAQSVDIPSFRSAVRAYAEGSDEPGCLTQFVNRIRHTNDSSAVVVELITGIVRKGETAVPLSQREFAILAFLSLAGRPVSRDAICDAVWPDTDPVAAANSLKVIVHRVRKKLGEDSIKLVPSGYCAGANVQNDLDATDSLLRAAAERGSLADAGPLDELMQRLLQRKHMNLMQLDWYVSLDHRLSELARQVQLRLIDIAFAQGEFSKADALAFRLLSADPTDEEACKCAVRAAVAAGDAYLAKRRCKEYEAAANADGDELAARRMFTFLKSQLEAASPSKLAETQ